MIKLVPFFYNGNEAYEVYYKEVKKGEVTELLNVFQATKNDDSFKDFKNFLDAVKFLINP